MIACGVLGLLVCSGALADDPVDDALSLVAQQRHAEAREAIEDMLERNPEAPGPRLLQGVLYAREGRLVEAVAIFEGLRNDHPRMFEAHNNLAVLYAKLGRLDDARKAQIAALELRPDAVVYANLGDVYMKLAEEAYERAHALRIEQEVAADVGGAADESEEADAAPRTEAAPVEPPAAEPTEEEVEVLAAVPPEPEIVEEPESSSEADSPDEPEASEEPESPEVPEEEVAEAPAAEPEESESPAEPEDAVAAAPAAEPQEPESVVEPAEQVVQAPTVEPDEPESAAEPESSEEPEEAVALAPGETCIQVGWFGERKDADEAAALMRAHGARALKVRSEEQQIVKNYQVYLPPAGSREAARALVRELRDKGLEDLWIIDRGSQIHGVSLGVFRNKRYMSRRVAQVEKLGYTVVTTANMRTVTEYAVEAEAGDERAALDDAWKAAFPDHDISDIDCADRA